MKNIIKLEAILISKYLGIRKLVVMNWNHPNKEEYNRTINLNQAFYDLLWDRGISIDF